ncbi:putative haloacid dehalogenase-like hydrolase [Syncephalastrum racemosum]|uniref:Putative haloacid dehalogenase-like hydrolase n=1 Tax=Syncephalastrum racemosum TaxID=13706 RepID=A0A1X2H6E6_SYNRA|nr:putative haloacid dehalogenase-like hydrolase [Syncephalastrum racemosum]
MTSTTHTLRAKAFIFDLDGTLIDTTPLVEKYWREFAREHNLDPEKILATSHGRRSIDTIAEWVPHKATIEYATECERKLADNSEGVSLLPGAEALLQKVPAGKFGICTGGMRYMVESRFRQCNLVVPNVLATADSVQNGKPHAEGYLQAAAGLGVDPKDCVVFEDAPSGVRAARAAGMDVVALLTTHSREQLEEAGATYIVPFLTEVDIQVLPDETFEVLVTVEEP